MNSLKTQSVVVSVLLAAVLVMSASAQGAGVAVNFTATSWGGGPYPLAPTETAGVVPQPNWNNTLVRPSGTTADIQGPLPGKLADSAGVDSGAAIAWTAEKECGNDGQTVSANERLYKGVLEGSFFKDQPISVTVTGVPYDRYDVYAYVAGFPFSASSSAKLGSQEYFYVQSSNFTTDGFIRATATSAAGASLATYARFENVTGDSFVLQIWKQSGNRPGLAGIEIVQVPEPAAMSLLILSAVAVLRRKRRQ